MFAADGTLLGWSAVQVAEASADAPTDTLATTGSSAAPLLAVVALLLVGGAGALALSRRGRAGSPLP